jgi:hypothetical protein
MKEQKEIYEDFEGGSEEDEMLDIKVPFDPKQVDITVEPSTISGLVGRIEHGEIDLFPEFQRNGNLWTNERMSQLIESILIKLPLPAFYIDVADDNKWIVVDGLQRLSTFKKFMVDKNLKLSKMEFLSQLDGVSYDKLDRLLKRRLNDTQVTLFKIRKGTPKKVLTSLFHRINTGGLKLTAQEIRHALNQGIATKFLKQVAREEWFKKHIKVSGKRMLDRELILRFTAFYRQGYNSYLPSLRMFLDNEMEYLNEDSTEKEREELTSAFQNSLDLSDKLFGKLMFSKALLDNEARVLINRSLFETTTVNFAFLDTSQVTNLLNHKSDFIEAYQGLMRDSKFEAAITANTNKVESVVYRHERMKQIITQYAD